MLFALHEGDHDINSFDDQIVKKHKNHKIGTHFYGKFSLSYQSTVPTNFDNYQYGLKISTFSLRNINFRKFSVFTINKNGIKK